MFEVPVSVYEDGAKLLTVEHRRELPQAKTTGYLTWLKNHPRIESEGAIDVLYHSEGTISEAATASVYIVRDGKIIAPGDGVLWGTVGGWTLKLAEEAGIPVEQRDVELVEVFSADECFLTSSVRNVVPITRVDDETIGDGKPGAVTKRLMELYAASIES
jgi:branched-chain amino acid aminotransferase